MRAKTLAILLLAAATGRAQTCSVGPTGTISQVIDGSGSSQAWIANSLQLGGDGAGFSIKRTQQSGTVLSSEYVEVDVTSVTPGGSSTVGGKVIAVPTTGTSTTNSVGAFVQITAGSGFTHYTSTYLLLFVTDATMQTTNLEFIEYVDKNSSGIHTTTEHSLYSASAPSLPVWVEISVSNATVEALTSSDGVNWTQIGNSSTASGTPLTGQTEAFVAFTGDSGISDSAQLSMSNVFVNGASQGNSPFGLKTVNAQSPSTSDSYLAGFAFPLLQGSTQGIPFGETYSGEAEITGCSTNFSSISVTQLIQITDTTNGTVYSNTTSPNTSGCVGSQTCTYSYQNPSNWPNSSVPAYITSGHTYTGVFSITLSSTPAPLVSAQQDLTVLWPVAQ